MLGIVKVKNVKTTKNKKEKTTPQKCEAQRYAVSPKMEERLKTHARLAQVAIALQRQITRNNTAMSTGCAGVRFTISVPKMHANACLSRNVQPSELVEVSLIIFDHR